MVPKSPGRPRSISKANVLEAFERVELPFITSSIVAKQYGCSIATARDRLENLVSEGQLTRYELDSRRTLYFQQNYELDSSIVNVFRSYFEVSNIDIKSLEAFAENPYKILPKSQDEYYIVVPQFIPFHAGHLHEQDDAWQIFIINKYISWIRDLPDEIEDEIDLQKTFDTAKVDGQILELSDEAERERAWEHLGGRDGGLHKRINADKIKIQNGKEFEIIAELIEGGNLPFSTSKVRESDIQPGSENIKLRDYQKEAWERFKEYGKIGVYWPPGTGKTFLALYIGERISGDKLVVVPTSTLEQQWEERIREFCRDPEEWEVRTYQYVTYEDNLQQFMGKDSPSLLITDECHRLPANTFSRLATIDSEYRIGLSASPYREDGRTDYIFALTGYPVGIDWEKLLEIGVVDYPEVVVYLYKNEEKKREDAVELISSSTGKGVVFCDSLDSGERLANEVGAPFVSGSTPKHKRRDLVQENRVTVISRVGDEGLSISNLDWSIEYQFHGGSRRQEIQRAGRVMHTQNSDPTHMIQMTDNEFEKFGERLHSLEERGIDIRFERRE